MNRNADSRWLVVTDLDGTLLDHHTYDFSAAREALHLLETKNIPVIVNTSKTYSEVEQLRTRLENRHPFIVENGSGIFIPKNDFPEQPEHADEWKDFWKITLGISREQLIDELSQVPKGFLSMFRAFHTMNTQDIMALTKLSAAEAELANQRYFSEPLQWLGTEEQKALFFCELRERKICFTEGGRFIHLTGKTHKGEAAQRLKLYYADKYQTKVKILALGDSDNDIDMLKTADIAVAIRSTVKQPPIFKHPCKIISEGLGPKGWAEIINAVFS
ncbi:MAG: mannosyl-3-phosphoglycerate phosphatase [Cellvibrionaceae bacterium]|jgi:mannosyl-3-phosphoglycerate phosphatase